MAKAKKSTKKVVRKTEKKPEVADTNGKSSRRVAPGSRKSERLVNKREFNYHKLKNEQGSNVFVLGEDDFYPMVQHWIKMPGNSKSIPVTCGGILEEDETKKTFPDLCPFCARQMAIYQEFERDDKRKTALQWREVAKTLWPKWSFWIWASFAHTALRWENRKDERGRDKKVEIVTVDFDDPDEIAYINANWDVLAITDAAYKTFNECSKSSAVGPRLGGLVVNFIRAPMDNNPSMSAVKTVEFMDGRFEGLVVPDSNYEPEYDADAVQKLYDEWEQNLDQLVKDTVLKSAGS